MDIEYVLFLQNFRNAIDNALTPFVETLSLFAVSYILLFPAFIYWCVDKRKGLFIFTAWKISVTINAIVKLTACIYRPWVRDARILPAGDAIKTAGGYSFPSGHMMMSTPIYGSLAMFSRNKILKCLFILLILFTAFSRNYLGVHTPQDVIVGLILGLFAIYIVQKIFIYLDAHPEKLNLFLVSCFIFGALTLVYITFKPYPMDYVNGKLLVDPVKMQIDAWGDAGGLVIFAVAWAVEKKFIDFKPTGFNTKGVILNAIGLVPLCFIIGYSLFVLKEILNPHLARFLEQVMLFGYVMIIWPLVIKFFNKN